MKYLLASLIILSWLLTPEVLCMIPGLPMTMDQHECCLLMGEDCGNIPMPDSHTCCKTIETSPGAVAQKASTVPALADAVADSFAAESEESSYFAIHENPVSPLLPAAPLSLPLRI